MWTCYRWLKIEESPFLDTLSRLAKVPTSEEIARWSNWKPPLCHAVSRSCHAPVTLLSRSCHGPMTKLYEEWPMTKLYEEWSMTKLYEE